ncbi:DUF1127 domain-containing protein [Epibacterium sp. SM1969]|uniref:DUF1127 domain-containing protein n=1 Tax=Tritonibacter aquimaris TaxID=2663379 RepID=A0A844AUG9_9RHOB|nr:DUF1127 domain-containing protein [Tritonibacter aquimaris]MQY43068.1 DUF1127 domain-containing protein [Tritonibacter aquimaris]
MAALNYAPTSRSIPDLFTRLRSALAKSIKWGLNKHEESRTRRALMALSERELNDIGLSRCDIEHFVRCEHRH